MATLLHTRARLFPSLACAAFSVIALWGLQASAGTIYGIDDQNSIFSFDNAAPQNIISGAFLTGLGSNEHLINIDFRPSNGVLYGISSGYKLYTVNPATGACTAVGAGFGFVPGNSFGMDVNPAADRIRFFSDADNNIRVNPDTGLLVQADTNLAYKSGDPKFGVNPNVVGAGYTNSTTNPAPATTTLYGIDSNTNSLVRIGGVDGAVGTGGSPDGGLLTTIGALGVDANNLVGFDISSNNVAFASLSTGGNSSLYGIDLSTGGAVNLGQIIGGVRVTDIALTPGVVFNLPEPTSIAMAAFGLATLVVFRKTRSRS